MFRHSSICMFFPRVGAVFVAKALFVGGNRNPLMLTQKKEVFVLIMSAEIFMGSTRRTLEEPGFMGAKVALEPRQP